MKIGFRRLRHGETDWELTLGLLPIPLLALGLLAARVFPPGLVPPCGLKHATGVPCFTCGTYRCIRHLVNGDIGAAFGIQPLCTMILAGAVLVSLYAWTVVCLRLPRLRWVSPPTRREWRALWWSLVGAVAVNWAYLILTGV